MKFKAMVKGMFKGMFASKLGMEIAAALAALIALALVGVGIRSYFSTDSKSTKLGFENIGELATQTAYCTQVAVKEKGDKFWGGKITFGQSKVIFSYDVVIKAGFDFDEIKWDVRGDNTIVVRLPEAKILSAEVNHDSFKAYHEKESVFHRFTMSEDNEALKKLVETAKKDAVANGLLENARSNAEMLLRAFFSKEYDLDEYEIKFK